MEENGANSYSQIYAMIILNYLVNTGQRVKGWNKKKHADIDER